MTDTIGQRLKKARKYRNLTLEKVEQATHIRAKFLQALEADDFSAMPSPVQARGFLRNYAQFLDLDLDQIIEELHAASQMPEAKPEVVFEGEQPALPSDEDQTDLDDEGESPSTEPFWQTWLKRNREESGQEIDDPAADLEPEPAPDIEGKPSPETEEIFDIDASESDEQGVVEEREMSRIEPRENLWAAILRWANIRISSKQTVGPAEKETEDEFEAGPEANLEPESQDEAPLSSEEIIGNIGLQLRQRREMLSLTLEEIERHTRMRAQFLRTLENGDFEKLSSPVQARGMLSKYAGFLDMDVDDLLLQFAEALQIRHRERHPKKGAGKRERSDIPRSVPTLRSFIAGDMLFGVGMALLLVVFVIWGISSVLAIQSDQIEEVQEEDANPSISEALIGTPVETTVSEVTLIPAEDTPIPESPEGTLEIPTLALNVNVQVNIVAVERTFLRVTVDGEVAFDGRTVPGVAYPYEAEESVEVLAGNGAALRVAYNQRDLGLLGGFGQIAHYLYTADTILVPTPVIPPTPTNTPFVSPTPSITPSPTSTEIPLDDSE